MQSNAWDRYNYLSLGGTSPLALIQYLKDHPHADHVYLCLDNDEAGQKAMRKIRDVIYKDEVLSEQVSVITDEPPPTGKDYNDMLLTVLEQQRLNGDPSRRVAAVSM
jgi:DNA primase